MNKAEMINEPRLAHYIVVLKREHDMLARLCHYSYELYQEWEQAFFSDANKYFSPKKEVTDRMVWINEQIKWAEEVLDYKGEAA